MGQVTVRQPNGCFGVFSTISDHFVLVGATLAEWMAWTRLRGGDDAVNSPAFDMELAHLAEHGRPRDSDMDFGRCIAAIRNVHGKEEADRVAKKCSGPVEPPSAYGPRRLAEDPDALADALADGCNRIANMAKVLSGAGLGSVSSCVTVAAKAVEAADALRIDAQMLVRPRPWREAAGERFGTDIPSVEESLRRHAGVVAGHGPAGET